MQQKKKFKQVMLETVDEETLECAHLSADLEIHMDNLRKSVRQHNDRGETQ